MKKLFNKPARSRRNKEIDLLAVGELLVDLIGSDVTDDLKSAVNFQKYQGGSPANLAANMAKLGSKSALISCIGEDNLGKFLKDKVYQAGVNSEFIVADPAVPTSMVIVSRSSGTADFVAYRSADKMLKPDHIKDDFLKRSSFYHTTCFALSKEPAQSSILDGAKRASEFGCILSIDANYAPSIWADRKEAQQIIAEYCSYRTFVKISLDDISRLFEIEAMEPGAAIKIFKDWGAELVCLTLGKDGSIIWTKTEKELIRIPGKQIFVADATGAGDAYWAGFLTAWLDGYKISDCAIAGSNLAEKKLILVGPLPDKIDRDTIYVGYS